MVKPPSREARCTGWEKMVGREERHGDRACCQPSWKHQRENSIGKKIQEDKRLRKIM